MSTEIRLKNIQRLVKSRFDDSQADFARAIGKSPAQVWQFMAGRRPVGEKLAHDIETALALSPGSLSRPEKLTFVPVVNTASVPIIGSLSNLNSNGNIKMLTITKGDAGAIAWPDMAENLIAYQLADDALRPRYRAGEYLIASAGRVPVPGDEILIILSPDSAACVGFLYSRAGRFEIASITDSTPLESTPAPDPASVFVIVGSARHSLVQLVKKGGTE